MSSEHLASAKDHLKGDLGGSWNILDGASGQYTDLGIARKFGGSAAAYSLRDIGAMNGRVVKVRREQDTTPVDFSVGAIASGGVEQFAIGQSVLDKYNDAAYFPADSAYFSITNIALTGSFTITVSFIFTGDENVNQQTLFWGNAGRDTISFTDYSTFRFRRDADNKTITLDSDIKKNTLHTLVVTRDGSNVVSISIDGVTQSNTFTEAGTYNIERMGFRNRGTEFDININGVAAYTGDGADASNWTDTLGSNDATKVGSPAAFTGQGISAFVDTWYDQSGNGNNLTQSTTALQPKIIKDGSLLDTGIDFDGSASYLDATSALGATATVGAFIVHKPDTTDANRYLIDNRDASNDGMRIMQREESSGNYRVSMDTTEVNSASGSVTTNETLLTAIQSSTALTLFKNAVSQATAADDAISVTAAFRIGANRVSLGTYFDGTINEIIMFTSDKTSDRTDIENDINNHYSIY
jgi:hypothetical protein